MISFVLTSRNDDHDPGLRRLLVCLRVLYWQIAEFGLDAEVILVEWNPPQNRPRLAEALACHPIRVITVPPKYHRRLEGHKYLDLFVLLARNVGIRRAGGDLVLPLNQDCVLSNELVASLPSMERDALYRIDRCDVLAEVPYLGTPGEILEFCAQNVVQVHSRPVPWGPHTNGSGDFTLLSRENWHRLRGYVEVPKYGLHLDSFLVFMALCSGIRQVVLQPPMCLYHISHDRGWTGEGPEGMRKRKVPILDEKTFFTWVTRMLVGYDSVVRNDENWGLAGEGLPERVRNDADLAVRQ